MAKKLERVFLFLVLAQATHSVEEYYAKLYEVLAPARYVSSLISINPALGFAITNTALVAFGMWCWAVPVRREWTSARGFVWGWAVLEFANSIAHSLLALSQGGYFPGLITAPLLLLFSGWLIFLLGSSNKRFSSGTSV